MNEDDNRELLEVLAGHADRIRKATKLAEVKHDSLQDERPDRDPYRQREPHARLDRGHVEEGRRVIVLQMIMTGQGGVTRRLHNDFAGLDYDPVDKADRASFFDRWVRETVQAAAASP